MADKYASQSYKRNLYPPVCSYREWGSPHSPRPARCGRVAVGVYISADEKRECRPFCDVHEDVYLDGDGPVYRLLPV